MKQARDNIKEIFNEFTDLFESKFGNVEDKILPFQVTARDWRNLFYKTSSLRHAHVEYYDTDKITVLHVNCFPHPGTSLPILGLDIVSIGNKITGLFFDITPTVSDFLSYRHCLQELKKLVVKSTFRELPEWANFFSKNFLCVTPEEDEFKTLISFIKDICILYTNDVINVSLTYEKSVDIQNKYCKGQKKNDKTFKALTAEIGRESANIFLNQYLFPEIE
jgi:hypothetical protein